MLKVKSGRVKHQGWDTAKRRVRGEGRQQRASFRARQSAHHGWALTGMFSMMTRFTVDTSLVRTQYLVVERLKACGRRHK